MLLKQQQFEVQLFKSRSIKGMKEWTQRKIKFVKIIVLRINKQTFFDQL
jgi:hypothetical protein